MQAPRESPNCALRQAAAEDPVHSVHPCLQSLSPSIPLGQFGPYQNSRFFCNSMAAGFVPVIKRPALTKLIKLSRDVMVSLCSAFPHEYETKPALPKMW